MDLAMLLVGVGLYVGVMRGIVLYTSGTLRDVAFAILNMAAVYVLFFPLGPTTPVAVFTAYVGLAVVQYGLLRLGGGTMIAFAAPILALVAIKGVAAAVSPDFELPGDRPLLPMIALLIGISYFAFRTSYLALEVRNGQVALPTLWQYLGFSFFAPTMAVGPINRYSTFRRGFEGTAAAPPAARAALRLLVGAVKYRFLAGIFATLAYGGLLRDGHPHHWIDLPIAAVAYYLYLYCNFSGFCDMAIGAAGLAGIPVEENFKNPFAARNVRDFWNRWHITLSTYMRDVVFTPASKYLTGLWGPKAANHAAALSIGVVFVLIGLWHGFSWNYVAFGAMHAVGVVAVHYYTLWLKKWLGRDKFNAYNSNPLIKAVATAVTFVYVSASFFLFANTVEQMRAIIEGLRW